MEKNDDATAIRLINQSLSAAASSISLAKKLLSELTLSKSNGVLTDKVPEISLNQLPGIIGTFDGQFMNTDDGQKFQIPENYASKSMIVFGDKLKMVDVNGEKRFKQIERTKRQRASGMIVKKEGRYHVVTSDGSYKISSAAVSFFGGKEGDEAHIILPLNNKHVPFAALESVGTKQIAETPTTPGTTSVVTNIDSRSEKSKLTQKPAIRPDYVGNKVHDGEKNLLIEKPKVALEKEKKEQNPPKKIAKTSKDKEGNAEERLDEKMEKIKVTVTEKEVEKPSTPLIGEDELR